MQLPEWKVVLGVAAAMLPLAVGFMKLLEKFSNWMKQREMRRRTEATGMESELVRVWDRLRELERKYEAAILDRNAIHHELRDVKSKLDDALKTCDRQALEITALQARLAIAEKKP